MKTARTFIFIVCLILAATICRAEEEFEPTKAEMYRAEGVTVVLPDDREPFSFMDADGKRTGYLPELWQAWAKHNGIEVRYEFMDDAAALEAMAANATDIHGGLRYDGDNIEMFDYADSVHSATSVLAIREDGDVDCSTAMAHGTIAIVDEPQVNRMAHGKYPSTRFFGYADEAGAITAFLDGKTDGVVVGYPHLAKMDEATSVLGGLKICRTVFYYEIYAGVQKGQVELLELVNTGLSNIPAEELSRIESRWFLTAERPKPKWLVASLPAAVAFIMLLTIAVMWVRRRR